MKILFDQGTPAPLRGALVGHDVITAFERGWQELKNGDLLAAAERDGFEAIVTTDKNLRYQQNLTSRAMAILVLPTTNWPRLKQHSELVAEAVGALSAGAYVELSIPTP